MPVNCPKNKPGDSECLICNENHDGYCWALCPPKVNRKTINEILTQDERLIILEAQIENIKYLEKVEDIDGRLVSLEDRANEILTFLEKSERTIQKINTLQDTVNLTLQRFSKRLISLEDTNQRKLKSKFNDYA